MAGPTRTEAQQWHKALLSVYYHGRREVASFDGKVREMVSSLDEAVTTLVSSRRKEALAPVRLALADLCRTRASGPDGEVDRHIERLATALSKLIGNSKSQHPEVVKSFQSIFERPIKANAAYEKAIGEMIARAPASLRRGSGLVRYSVARK